MRMPGPPKTWVGFAAVAGAFAVAGAMVFSSLLPPDAIRKKDITRAFAQLRDDVGALYRAARPNAPRLGDDPDDSRPKFEEGRSRAVGADLERELVQTRRVIADLITESLGSRNVEKEESGLVWNFSFARSGQNTEWKAEPQTTCRSLLVTNDGPSIATDVRVLIDGKTRPATAAEIVGRAVDSSMDEKQKATALWKAVVDGRRHDWPAHNEAEDPVKLLGVYGYGFCSHAAHALAALARQAGLGARVLQARGKHLVTEIMVDGKWAVFDADAETCYTMPNGQLASAEDLRSNPQLLAASPSKVYSEAKLRDFYSSPDLRENKASPDLRPHTLQVNLRPGESIGYSRAKKGLFFVSKYFEEPRDYANGQWVFEPLARDQLWLRGCKTSANLRSVQETGDSWSFAAEKPGSPAQIAYAFELPYPALDGKIQVASTGGQPTAEISRDGINWQEVAGRSSGDDLWIFPLAEHLNRVSGSPDYRFEIRLTFAPDTDPLRISRISYQFDLQMAPRYLPLPSQDAASLGVEYSSDGPAALRVQTLCDPIAK